MTSNSVKTYSPFGSYDPNARRKLLANNLATAAAAGSPRDAIKSYDRPGMSRGRAQQNQAGIDSARDMAAGIRDAYAQDDALANAAATSDLQRATDEENFAVQMSAMQQQDAYSRQLAALNAQQQRMNFVSGLLGGLLR